MMKKTVMEFICGNLKNKLGRMEENMKDIGRMGKKRDSEDSLVLKVKLRKENGIMTISLKLMSNPI